LGAFSPPRLRKFTSNSPRHGRLQRQDSERVMITFAVLGVVFLALFLAPLFGQDRPVARY